MKILISTLICLIVISCNKQEENNLSETQYSIDKSRYMTNIYNSNSNCKSSDFINLKIGNKFYEYNYGFGSNSGMLLCKYIWNNNIQSSYQEHYVNLPIPTEPNICTPNLPIQSGFELLLDSTTPAKAIINGLSIQFKLPKNFENSFATGTYKLRNNQNDIGFFMTLSSEVKLMNGDEISGPALIINKEKYYKFEINCIDKSKPNEIRLTGNFKATFVGDYLLTFPLSMTYEIPLSGEFSYIVEY